MSRNTSQRFFFISLHASLSLEPTLLVLPLCQHCSGFSFCDTQSHKDCNLWVFPQICHWNCCMLVSILVLNWVIQSLLALWAFMSPLIRLSMLKVVSARKLYVTTHLTVYVEGLIGLAPLEVPPPCRVCNQIKFISKYVYFSVYKMAKKFTLFCFATFASAVLPCVSPAPPSSSPSTTPSCSARSTPSTWATSWPSSGSCSPLLLGCSCPCGTRSRCSPSWDEGDLHLHTLSPWPILPLCLLSHPWLFSNQFPG